MSEENEQAVVGNCPQKRPSEEGLFFVTPLAQALPD
jgi:hypothetical protein